MEKLVLVEVAMETKNGETIVTGKTLKTLDAFLGKENVAKFKTELARIVSELINKGDD